MRHTGNVAHGLEGIVVAETRLSEVDGERGRLVIGGYAVEELAPHARFEEVLFLLWHGRLPEPAEREALRAALAEARRVPPATLVLVRDAVARGAAAMDALRMGVASLLVAEASAGRAAQERAAVTLVGAMPTIIAAYWRAKRGAGLPAERPDLGHVAAYLWLLEGREPDAAAVRALETYCNTVIDHGMNASTFTARVITSTGSDMASALVGGIGALKGPLHGGAPGPALDLVFAVRERAKAGGRPLADEAASAVRGLLANGERLMGFGHRVYRVRDPRADVLGAAAPALFARSGDAQLFDDARVVEDVTLRVLREHKPGRRIETNVEFYTALLLHGVGLSSELFTPTFALARAGGWTAHVLEQMGDNRLIRPSAEYVGARDGRWPRAA
ncbi:MAG: citrate/2-methylcitrate synthase [bacterium]